MTWAKFKITALIVTAATLTCSLPVLTIALATAKTSLSAPTPNAPANPSANNPIALANPAGGPAAPTVDSMPPVVVATDPQAGLIDVDPATKTLSVTFSKPMRDGDWSWAQISNDTFPKTTGKPQFLEDHKTCVLPVQLEPGKTYVVLLNPPRFNSFQDMHGNHAIEYQLVFQTHK